MVDLPEQVALVGHGEHENDDDEATLAPRKHSLEDGDGPSSWKKYTTIHRENASGHTSRSSYASLVDDDEV